MNTVLNPTQDNTRRGEITLAAAVDFTGGDPVNMTRGYLAKVANNSGTPNAYFPTTVDDICLYIVDDCDVAGNPVALETPNTGENCRIKARGTGNAGDQLILADVQRVVNISGTSNANPDVITTTVAHGALVGESVTIAGVLGDLAVNGESFVLTTPSSTTFTISATPGGVAIAGSGAYVSGGTATLNVGDSGKVRSLTGSLAPTAPGRYFRAAVAEENFVDGQLVKAKWFPGEVRIVSAFTATGTESTDIAALKAILETQGLVA